MAEPDTQPTKAPLGAWWRLYVLCAAAASAVLFLLWWFTHAFNLPMGVA